MSGDVAASGQLRNLLDFVKTARGFDFSGYKRATLGRRIERRMHAVSADTYAAYQDYLEVNPHEFTALFDTILINVTSFFRDPQAWDYMTTEAVPKLLASLSPAQPVRVWSAGCASGEEAYTVAIVLAEALGDEAFKQQVKIYATDLDDHALARARHAVYPNDSLEAVPEPLRKKYFEPNADGMEFRTDLRRSIIFGRNDLLADAPISRIDLLVCRNVLMYFTPEAQARILERFNFALVGTGFLFLGKSEMLITHGELFSPYNLKWRVFRKVQRNNLRDRLAFVVAGAYGESASKSGIRSAAAAMAPTAQIIVDQAGFLVDANRRAREMFAIVEADLGRRFQDVHISYRPADLRSAIAAAHEQRAPVHLSSVADEDPADGERILDIEVAPIFAPDGTPLGTSISFSDVSTLVRVEADSRQSKRELENAYEELESTVEELETTNEELQSTNEELETTNEELQSTNEELETMNEELQSTNDELETMNNEVNVRAVELDRVNLFLEGILGSLGVGVIVIDSDYKIRAWNATSNELWGLRADEVEGQDFLELDIGLPVKELKGALEQAFRGATTTSEQRVDAVNRRGQPFQCLVRIMPLHTRAGDIYGTMLLAAPVTTSGTPAASAAA